MSLPQQKPAKYNWQNTYTAKQVLANESLVANQEKIAMYALMERAGNAVFKALIQGWPMTKSILILCGKGNNGGDGFIAARLAHLANINTTVLVTCDIKDLKGDALIAYQAMVKAGVSNIITDNLANVITEFTGDVLVDALFGIGFSGVLDEPLQQLISNINCKDIDVLSVDIPSGLCATTGFVNDDVAIIADMTVTFIVYKQGLFTGQAANFVGEIVLADIGLGEAFHQFVVSQTRYQSHTSSTRISLLTALKERVNTSHKGNIGQILAIGGGLGMPGAIRLASEAALRCGASLVAVSCHSNNVALVVNGRPELMIAPNEVTPLLSSDMMKKSNVLIMGPGLGQTDWSKDMFNMIISEVLASKNKWLVLDADGLNLLADTKLFYSRWILTPHPKEAARLLQCNVKDVEADRFSAVKKIATQYGGICILKGAGTLISDGSQTVINSTGNAGMASGGMGDVLAGVVAALTLQANDYFTAACLAVYIHGASGDIIAKNNGQRGMLASDLFIPLQKIVN